MGSNPVPIESVGLREFLDGSGVVFCDEVSAFFEDFDGVRRVEEGVVLVGEPLLLPLKINWLVLLIRWLRLSEFLPPHEFALCVLEAVLRQNPVVLLHDSAAVAKETTAFALGVVGVPDGVRAGVVVEAHNFEQTQAEAV